MERGELVILMWLTKIETCGYTHQCRWHYSLLPSFRDKSKPFGGGGEDQSYRHHDGVQDDGEEDDGREGGYVHLKHNFAG